MRHHDVVFIQRYMLANFHVRRYLTLRSHVSCQCFSFSLKLVPPCFLCRVRECFLCVFKMSPCLVMFDFLFDSSTLIFFLTLTLRSQTYQVGNAQCKNQMRTKLFRKMSSSFACNISRAYVICFLVTYRNAGPREYLSWIFFSSVDWLFHISYPVRASL